MTENKEIVKKTYKIFEQNGQLKITLPKVLAQSVGLQKGSKIEFFVDRGELVIRKV